MSASAWSTIASLATALGTLVLAVATFSAVRSSNLMAKIAQEQFLVQLRPVLTTSRREDPALKVNFGDTKWVRIPGGGAVGEMFVAGPVTAVSSTSITIGGPNHTVTAAITSSTRITGKVTSIGGIKVGDQVSAQITESNGGQPTVAAIQDPAQAPSGGSLP